MTENILDRAKLKDQITSLSVLSSAGWDYLSSEGQKVLGSITKIIKEINQPENRLQESTSFYAKARLKLEAARQTDSLCSEVKNVFQDFSAKKEADKKIEQESVWASVFNTSESWDNYIKKCPQKKEEILKLKMLWEEQNTMALCSNEWLLLSIENIISSLKHIKKAKKEYQNSHWRLPEGFSKEYGNLLKQLDTELKETKKQILSAMYLRLKISHHYHKSRKHTKADVDDVIFYMTEQLSLMGALQPEDKKNTFALSSTISRLEGKYYIQFQNILKRHTKSSAKKKIIELFHWSKHSPHTGFINTRLEIVEDKASSIAFPDELKKHIPTKRRTPAWFYWQENQILDFLQDRQSFLFTLFRINGSTVSLSDSGSLKNLHEFQNLIENELRRVKEIKKDFSFFAFDVKEMVRAWRAWLSKVYADSLKLHSDVISKATSIVPLDTEIRPCRQHTLSAYREMEHLKASFDHFSEFSGNKILTENIKTEEERVKTEFMEITKKIGLSGKILLIRALEEIETSIIQQTTVGDHYIQYLFENLYPLLINEGKEAVIEEIGTYRESVMKYARNWLYSFCNKGAELNINISPLSWYCGLIKMIGTNLELARIREVIPGIFINLLMKDEVDGNQQIEETQTLSKALGETIFVSGELKFFDKKINEINPISAKHLVADKENKDLVHEENESHLETKCSY